MLLEYLISKEKKGSFLAEMSDFSPSCVELNSDCYLVSVVIEGKSETSAKKASDLNDKVLLFEPTVLTNSSAEYYNIRLYPLVNGFERKLRKLLYAASALQNVGANTITDLEKKDFGEIFGLLFRDVDYQKRVKAYVNGGKAQGWSGYSSELSIFLETENENLLWDRLLPGQVPTLRREFFAIQRCRNDVMHAHNIHRKEFTDSQKLFKTINTELDEAIKGLSEGKLVPPETYNYELVEALKVWDGSHTETTVTNS